MVKSVGEECSGRSTRTKRGVFRRRVICRITAVALSALALRLWVIAPYRVGSDAMAPDYKQGSTVFVCKLLPIRQGQVVLFRPQTQPTQLCIGRITACAGDRICQRAGITTVNGRILRKSPPPAGEVASLPLPNPDYELSLPAKGKEQELTPDNLAIYRAAILREQGNKAVFTDGDLYLSGQRHQSYTFLRDYYWILTDNLAVGPDSRHTGIIAREDIIGSVFARF